MLSVVDLQGLSMPVTASILYDLVRCPQRVALDAFSDPAARDQINPYVRLLWKKGTQFEREVIEGLEQPFLDLSAAKEGDKEHLTLEAMKRGEALIYGRADSRGCSRDLRFM